MSILTYVLNEYNYTMNETINELDNLYEIRTNIVSDIIDLKSFFVNKDGFTIFHLNIRSINKNFSQLLVMLNNIIHFIDCIILTECWLSNCVVKFEIDGFISYRTSDNNFNQNSGIVAFVNSKHTVNNFSEIIIDNCNCLVLSLCSNNVSREIIALYRGHNNIFIKFKNCLGELISRIKTKKNYNNRWHKY